MKMFQDGEYVLTEEALSTIVDEWVDTLDRLEELHEKLLDLYTRYVEVQAKV